jgi:hypothetical protein
VIKNIPKVQQSPITSFGYRNTLHSRKRWYWEGICNCGCFLVIDRKGFDSPTCRVVSIKPCKTHKGLKFNTKLKNFLFEDRNVWDVHLLTTHPQQYVLDAMNKIIDDRLSISRYKEKDELNHSLVKHLDSM